MNIVKAYCRGFKNSLRHPKMIMLIFGITLILGLSLALPFFFSFKSAVGNSMVSKNLDYTTFTELIHFHSWNLDSITSQAKFTILIFWLLMIFFVGGIVRTFNKEDFSVSTFFAGAGVNFFRFLLCDVIMIVAQVITALLLFGIASFVLSLFNNVVTETPLFWAYGVSAFIFACAIVLWLMISDYAKFYMEMENTSRVFKAIGKATSFVFSNFVKTYFLYALLLVIPILTLVLYKLTFDKIGMATAFGIIAMFFVQQMFIILRIWYRIWSLSSQFELYADDYVKVISYDLESNGQHLEVDAVETEDNVEEKNTDTKVTTITTTTTTETTETTIKNEESTDDNSLSKNAVASDIIVVNEEGDTFNNTVATTDTTGNDAESKSESNTETKTEVTVTTITTETTETTSTDDTSKSDTADRDEPDDVDTELLEHFYAGESENASEQTSETESKVEETSETESKVEEVSESEPEDNEMTQFYAADQDDSIYESNLAKLDLEEEAEKQSEKQSEISSDNNVKDDAVVDTNTDTDAESKNDSVAIEVTTNIEPSNSESENNTDNESDNKSDSKIVLEVDSNTEVALEENTETTDNEKSEETEPDDIDEELLAQFYGNEESDMHETDSDPIEVVDIDDVDESVGSAVSLDVEDEDDDVVVTTTTTTTTTTTVVTEETVNDGNQPKIIKIYSEQEMRDIAKEQQENAGFKPDVEFTEIVSEDEEDGVVSGEQHSEEEFVQKNLQDGDDFNNPDSDALG